MSRCFAIQCPIPLSLSVIFILFFLDDPPAATAPAPALSLLGFLKQSLLAHQQIYVDTTLQRGNEDYWKE